MSRRKPARLALADGTVFTGVAFGAEATRAGEVVFNTAHSGYQEVITDPSYSGQIVCMTYSLQGNYGVTAEDEIAIAGLSCPATDHDWISRRVWLGVRRWWWNRIWYHDDVISR